MGSWGGRGEGSEYVNVCDQAWCAKTEHPVEDETVVLFFELIVRTYLAICFESDRAMNLKMYNGETHGTKRKKIICTDAY